MWEINAAESRLVGVAGFEPATPSSRTRSPQLLNSSKSLKLLARPKRFELLTPRFVVWPHPLSRNKIFANQTLPTP
jgi:hypothetical protein